MKYKGILAAMLVAAQLSAVHAEDHMVFKVIDGKRYWYENGERQGVYGDKKNIVDLEYGMERGREIYDPATNAWYWLDAVYDGAAATDKEVWMPYVFQDEENGITDGKWVRYDSNGAMVKGWYTNENGRYYYDLVTGEMIKGNYTIQGEVYFFDPVTGLCQGLAPRSIGPGHPWYELAVQWSGISEYTCEYWAEKFSRATVGFAEHSFSPNMYEITREEVRPGDMIGYYSGYSGVWHVCIYLSDTRAFHGNYFVNGKAQTVIAEWPSPGAGEVHFFRCNHNSPLVESMIYFGW